MVEDVLTTGDTPALSSTVRASITQPDVTLSLDMGGVIEKVSLSSAMPDESFDAWLGRPWIETVGDSGGEKVRRMIEDARTAGVSGFRQMTQRFPSGLELPMEYATIRLGPKRGLIAVGKNLRAVAELQSRLIAAQHSLERDFWKLREIETRYRLLFEASSEGIVFVKPGDLRIIEANPRAVQALALDAGPGKRGRVAGREILSRIALRERASFQGLLLRVSDGGKSPGIVLHLGPDRQAWMVRASLVVSDSGPAFLIQLTSSGGTQLEPEHADASMSDLIERVPDAFVVVDDAGTIVRSNRAFRDLIEVGSDVVAVGEPLARWLWRPGADVPALMANIRKHGAVRLFSSTIHGELGSDTEVEISATGDVDSGPKYAALVLRDVGRRIGVSDEVNHLGSVLSSIAERIGKTSLRHLVRDTVDVVEQHHIKAVLDLVDGNRTAAAERLGLSRQSLYAKIDRYGLDTASRNDAETED